MKGILTDVNTEDQGRILLGHLRSDVWGDLWSRLNLPMHTFSDLGLDPRTPDSGVWLRCQQDALVLITANRNDDGPDSLEATLRARNTDDSLPVFTISDAERMRVSRDYADRVAEKFLDYLLDIDRVRGTGRLYLP